jgi:hypothetical protein
LKRNASAFHGLAFGIASLEETRMRTLIRKAAMALVAAGLVGGAATLTPAPAKAASVHFTVGEGHHHHWRRHHWRRHHHRCRVVVTHRWRHGHRVTVRRRTCW